MFVVRGGVDDPDRDRLVARAIVDRVARTGESGVRVWRPHRQVAFGPRDVRHDGYPAAAAAARDRGFPPTERTVGGRPVAMSGTTVGFTWGTPIEDVRRGLDDRYATVRARVARALRDLGVEVTPGEPPDSFCPGRHALSAGGKVVGLAQRVTTGAATVSGVVLTTDHAAIAGVLAPVYAALDLAFDPDTVGSVARAGGRADPEGVVEALERHLVGDRSTVDLRVRDLLATDAP